MKTIHILICGICAAAVPFTSHAERLRLKYAATAIVLDDAGNRIGTRQLKGGTEIAVVEGAPAANPKPAPTSAAGRPSGISPAQFLAERRTTPTTFVAVGTLDPDPVIFDEKRLKTSTHWCAGLGIYGKSRQSHELVDGYALKTSSVGSALFKILKDGEQHKLLVTIRCFPNTQNPQEVEITAVRELQESDPLVQALLATPL